MSDPRPHFDAERIAEFCRHNHIRRLALFGSILRDDFGPDSDVDVLVEFEPGVVIGWNVVSIEEELAKLIGWKVDLKTPGDLSRHFRDRVVSQAKELYAAA